MSFDTDHRIEAMWGLQGPVRAQKRTEGAAALAAQTMTMWRRTVCVCPLSALFVAEGKGTALWNSEGLDTRKRGCLEALGHCCCCSSQILMRLLL